MFFGNDQGSWRKYFFLSKLFSLSFSKVISDNLLLFTMCIFPNITFITIEYFY